MSLPYMADTSLTPKNKLNLNYFNGFKFADMLQRVDCYHGMFLNQTEMLMCGQLDTLANEFEKIKVLDIRLVHQTKHVI